MSITTFFQIPQFTEGYKYQQVSILNSFFLMMSLSIWKFPALVSRMDFPLHRPRQLSCNVIIVEISGGLSSIIVVSYCMYRVLKN